MELTINRLLRQHGLVATSFVEGDGGTIVDDSSNVYGVRIDVTNSNPTSAVTYTDDAIGKTAAHGNNGTFDYGSWQQRFPFNKIKPCLFKNGEVLGYLNPDDYTKFINGTDADIITNDGRQVMIEIPTIYWKIEKTGNYVYVRYSGVKKDANYRALAHEYNANTTVSKIFVAAYLSSRKTNESPYRAYSLSGKTFESSMGVGTARSMCTEWNTASTNIGSGMFSSMSFHHATLFQVLYLIMFKSLDTTIPFGRSPQSYTVVGGSNKKGLFYGDNTGSLPMKFCGIEALFGSVRTYVDGISLTSGTASIFNPKDSTVDPVTATYIQQDGYITNVSGTTFTGFLPTAMTNGSSTTYFTDRASLATNGEAGFGGATGISGQIFEGIFTLDAGMLRNIQGVSYEYTLATRLVYM